jgi:uncharacterized protein (TIGR02452 family)
VKLGYNTVVLNFASATRPGGGVKSGAKTQEEDLCRRTTLYPSLLVHPEFYTHNHNLRPIYSDAMIYTDNVLVFRDKYFTLQFYPFMISVISCPAPNKRACKGSAHKVEGAIRRRIRNILNLAIDKGHEVIILGSWGCGVFGNDRDFLMQVMLEEFKTKKFRKIIITA